MKKQTEQPAHTKGELWIDEDGFIACGKGDEYVSFTSTNVNDLDIDEREANAQRIVKAVNSFDQLRNALWMIYRDIDLDKVGSSELNLIVKDALEASE